MTSSTPHWEQFKENAAPLERGRNVEKLSRALAPQSFPSKPQSQRQDEDKNIRAFERLVRSSEKFAKLLSKHEQHSHRTLSGDDLRDMLQRCKVDKDPIIPWLRYIKYHEETYPSDTNSQFLLMERCTQSLLRHPDYINDVRFIRVCVLYADRTDSPHEQFKFFHTLKLGSEVAIFWLSWAWVAEKKKDFQFAEKIFRKAIQNKAKPSKVVNERYKQFQRRMSRYWLNANASNPETVYDGEEREAAARNKRSALSGLTKQGVSRNHRGLLSNAGCPRQSIPLDARNGQTDPIGGNNAANSQQVGGFRIFAEERDNAEGGYDLNQSLTHGDGSVPLPRMVKAHERKKENTLAAEAWNERGGLHGHVRHHDVGDDERATAGASSVVQRWAGTGTGSAAAGGTLSQPAFQVFVDDDCAEKAEVSDTTKLGQREKRNKEPKLRVRLEEMPARERLRAVRSSSDQRDTKHGDMSTTNPAKKKSSQGDPQVPPKQPLGFDRRLLKDRHGKENCFEEHRAVTRCFKLETSSKNFNLLHKTDDFCSTSSDMCMDEDDASTVEEVDMSRSISVIKEEKAEYPSGLNVTTLQSTVCGSNMKNSNPKKVLFALNTSVRSSSFSRVHNTSTASSTVDDRDAVGVAGDREETMNTKFAARELSMMFSSPAGALKQPTQGTTGTKSERLLFSVQRDGSSSSISKPLRSDKRQTGVNSGDAFAIFCDPEADGQAKAADRYTGFAAHLARNNRENIPSRGLQSIGVYGGNNDSDSDDSDSHLEEEEGENGDTASLADMIDLKNIMEDASPGKSKKPEGNGGFSIFCDGDDGSGIDVDDGTLLMEDAAAFGDLSMIPASGECDTVNIGEKMKGISLS